MTDTSHVYIVSAGEYSDYRICAVFLERDQAEAYVTRYNGPELGYGLDWRARVEVWEVAEERDSTLGAFRYCLWGYRDATRLPIMGGGHWDMDANPDTPPTYDAVEVAWVGYGRTEEHARRSATELARRQIAEGMP